ncbi:MAG: hypothetical protein LQ350_006016 [Teloschistes chrysophthalmus]|nr:MAG: hypothetical protein LQ350_006016 [Niorma chrysophthalma]
MADSLQQLESEHDCITPRRSTTIDLRYPSIPVNGTPDSWLTNSLLVPMASHQDEDSVRSSDDTMSSLDDSAYDFVEDASCETTDDEDHSRMNESASIVGESTLDTIVGQDRGPTLSGNGTQQSSSEDHKSVSIRGPISNSASPKDGARLEPSSQDTRLHGTNSSRTTAPTSFQFQEVHHGEGVHRLESLSMPPGFALTVRQCMLGPISSLRQPSTMLYVGDMAAREQIVTKIRTAKEAAQRFVVRHGKADLPHGSVQAPEVVVYHCTDASFGRMDNGLDTIDLTLEGQVKVQSSWSGSRFSITGNWEVPDLAIFYLSEVDSVSAKQTRRFARSFIARHEIPSIVVTEKTSWDRPPEAMVIDHSTPHLCLQTDEIPIRSSRVSKRRPIDLKTFLQLDDLQLSQNLVYLAMQCGKSGRYDHPSIDPSSTAQLSIRGAKVTQQDVSFLKAANLHKCAGISTVWLAYLLLFLAGVSMYMAAGTAERIIFSTPTRDTSNIHIASGSSSSIASPAVATSIPFLNSKAVTLRGLTAQELGTPPATRPILTSKSTTDLAALLLEYSPTVVNKSEHFKVQVLGGAHLILRPPHWFTRLRKTPRLLFKVTQGSRVLQHQVSTLFDGVYALEIPQEDARGRINITVWTESKPKIHENLHAEFSNSWLYAAGWKKAATALSTSLRRDLDMVQTSFVANCMHSNDELQRLLRKTLVRAGKLRMEASTIGKVSAERLTSTMRTMLAWESRRSTEFKRMIQKKDAAIENVYLHTKRFQRQLSEHLSGRVRAASTYVHAAPNAYRIHLKNTQKKALKFWWSVVGLPDHAVASAEIKCKSYVRSGRSKGRACVK